MTFLVSPIMNLIHLPSRYLAMMLLCINMSCWNIDFVRLVFSLPYVIMSVLWMKAPTIRTKTMIDASPLYAVPHVLEFEHWFPWRLKFPTTNRTVMGGPLQDNNGISLQDLKSKVSYSGVIKICCTVVLYLTEHPAPWILLYPTPVLHKQSKSGKPLRCILEKKTNTMSPKISDSNR